MLKLIKIGGAAIGITVTLGVLNGKYNQNKIYLPKFSATEFEEKMKNQKENNNPKLSLAKTNRDDNIKSLSSSQFDILVIGGGATGSGVLLNCYNKGLKCALIESKDFSSGTSSRSTKLAHGGIRYLEEVFEFKKDSYQKYKLVGEALIERDYFLNSSPHLNKIIEIKIPISNIFKVVYYFLGCTLYHFIYFSKCFPNIFYSVPGPKIYLSNNDINSKPSVTNNFKYFVSLHEGQMFDSRQGLLSLLTTTIDNYIDSSPGAIISNYTEFKEFLLDDKKQIIGVKALDIINNKTIDIKAKIVVNCAGIFTDVLLNKDDPDFNKLICASKGIS